MAALKRVDQCIIHGQFLVCCGFFSLPLLLYRTTNPSCVMVQQIIQLCSASAPEISLQFRILPERNFL
jgi:hypothetical protein